MNYVTSTLLAALSTEIELIIAPQHRLMWRKNPFFKQQNPTYTCPSFFLHYCSLRENAPKLVCLRKILSCRYIRLSLFGHIKNIFISKFMSVWYHVVDNDVTKEVQDSFTSFSHWLWYIALYAFGFWPRNKWIHDLQPQYYGRTFFENLIDNCRKWALVWNSSSQDPFYWCSPHKIPKWTSRKEKEKKRLKKLMQNGFSLLNKVSIRNNVF